jgi:hypothetical protein
VKVVIPSYGGGGGGGKEGRRDVVGANRTLEEYDGLSIPEKSEGFVGTTLIVVGVWCSFLVPRLLMRTATTMIVIKTKHPITLPIAM